MRKVSKKKLGKFWGASWFKKYTRRSERGAEGRKGPECGRITGIQKANQSTSWGRRRPPEEERRECFPL